MGRRIDIGAVVAMAWLFAAALATVLLAGQLGTRGWAWLGVHHTVCVIGAGHELWRSRRRRLRRALQQPEPQQPELQRQGSQSETVSSGSEDTDQGA